MNAFEDDVSVLGIEADRIDDRVDALNRRGYLVRLQDVGLDGGKGFARAARTELR